MEIVTLYMRTDIAKWAIVNGNRPAAKKYNISESTIRECTKSYKEDQFGDEITLDLFRVKNAVVINYYMKK